MLLSLLGAALIGSGLISPDYTDILFATDTAAGDGFGSSVAISGNTLAIGAYREGGPSERRGALYVGERLAGQRWGERVKLVAPDAVAGDEGGFSIALDGDWLAAGSIGGFGKEATERSSGRVDVYRRDDGIWNHHVELTRAGAREDDRYGFSIALADGVLVVGAPGVDDDAGGAYVHRLDNPDAVPLELRAPEPVAGDRFGESVAFDGRTIFVGAPHRDGSQTDSGAVFIFAADGEHWRSAGPPLESPVPVREGRFGVGVDVDGDHAIIGASHWRSGGPPGEVWFVSRDVGYRWGRPYLPLAEDDAPDASAPDDMEGFRVALEGSLAAASAHLADGRGKDSGGLVTYVLAADGWRRAARISPPDGDAGDHYSIALAIDEGVIAVGAEKADARGRQSGGVYLVEPSVPPLPINGFP